MFIKKRKKLVLGFILLVVVIIGIYNALIIFYNSGYFGFNVKNTANNTKIYTNKAYSLEYPSSYKSSGVEEYGLHLDKNQVWGDERDEYTHVKGVFLIANYQEHVDLATYAAEYTMYWEVKQSKKKKLKNREVIEVTTGYDTHPLKVPSCRDLFIKNKNDVFSIAICVGDKITKEEYSQYWKEFEAIVTSVEFLK